MHEQVKEYYGKTLTSSADLQTNACCTDEGISPKIKAILANIHADVLNRYYGCGLIVPELLNKADILDLGCGAGRDCYALAQLVGEQGSVTGVDMTDAQLEVAKQYISYHQQRFAYPKANTRFIKGYIEKLALLDLKENSFDVITSNCVINLCPDKAAVLSEAYRLLKPGGEIYFSDVYADRRVPQHLKDDPLLYGECLSGALYWQDFQQLAQQAGFIEPRIVTSRAITLDNDEVAKKVGDIRFTSITYRLFKAKNIELYPQDYGQQVIYQGGINENDSVEQNNVELGSVELDRAELETFELDQHTHFKQGQATHVSGNTWQLLKQSRFADYFIFVDDVQQNAEQHLGPFIEINNETYNNLDFQIQPPISASTCAPTAPSTAKKGCC